MRCSNLVVAVFCAISLPAVAGTPTEETKSKSEGAKIEMSKQNTKLAVLTSGASAGASQSSASTQLKSAKAASEQTQSDNVQGLTTSDRRYRYYD